MKKYPKIKRLGHDENDGILYSGDIAVQEKLDGANFRFTLDDNLDTEYQTEGRDFVFGSRNVMYKNEKDIDDAFDHAIEHVREHGDATALREMQGDSDLVVFGEAMHPHTLEYEWDDAPSFIGFGVWSSDNGFLSVDDAYTVIVGMGLEKAPVVYSGPTEHFDIGEITDDDGLSTLSSEYRDGLAEGFVVKNSTTGQRAKVRSEPFKEKHDSQSSSKPDAEEPDDSTVLAHKYTTEARVLKQIHKYKDRGRTIEMGVMEDLWRDVFDDIIEEEYDTIFLDNHVIDTKEFRSEVASITAGVLQQYMQRPDGSVLNEA